MMPPEVGETAPDFTLPTQRGVLVSLSAALRDGPVRIAFPGRVSHPAAHARILWLARICTAVPAMPNFPRPLVIVPNSPDEAKRYVEEVGTPFHLLCDDDGRVTALYGVRRPLALRRDTRPALFDVDANGVITSRQLDAWIEIEAGEKTNPRGRS
jgi:peroxiredoxin